MTGEDGGAVLKLQHLAQPGHVVGQRALRKLWRGDPITAILELPNHGTPTRGGGLRGRVMASAAPVVFDIHCLPPGRGGRMTSEMIRDPVADHLLTPQNCALVIIDYQPTQIQSIRSMSTDALVDNIVRMARIAVVYDVPIVLSTVNVQTGRNAPTVPALLDALPKDIQSFDRTSINAWEDVEFRGAVAATGRKKLLMTALWTEACLAFPALDALREAYDAYPVVDAVGGTSLEAHRSALARVQQAGARLTTWVQVICELQRDWARDTTSNEFSNVLFGGPKAA
jgi:nicotinamidase-related amidase